MVLTAALPAAKKPTDEIVEKRNVPLAITTFTPRKTHVVRSTEGKLLKYGMRLTPFVVQNLDGTGRKGGIRVKVYVGFRR